MAATALIRSAADGKKNLLELLAAENVPQRLQEALTAAGYTSLRLFVFSFGKEASLDAWLRIQCEEKGILGDAAAASWQFHPAVGALRAAFAAAKMTVAAQDAATAKPVSAANSSSPPVPASGSQPANLHQQQQQHQPIKQQRNKQQQKEEQQKEQQQTKQQQKKQQQKEHQQQKQRLQKQKLQLSKQKLLTQSLLLKKKKQQQQASAQPKQQQQQQQLEQPKQHQQQRQQQQQQQKQERLQQPLQAHSQQQRPLQPLAAGVLKRPAASGSGAPAAKQRKQDAVPLSVFKARVSLDALQREAEKVGFQAKDYLRNGFTVLQHPVLTDEELALALGAAQRVRNISKSSNNGGEFVFLRSQSTDDRRRLFALLNKYLPLLHQLLGGIRLPGSDWAPYAHHNQVQVAIKRPGFEGYGRLDQMSSSLVGHIDQPSKKQIAGKAAANYSLLLGVVLSGDTASRSDAGNLFVAPRTHTMLAEAFRRTEGPVPWYADIAGQHLDPENPPRMKAVRAKPGQAILMHHQTVHGVGPNHSDEDRVNIYFRITSKGRPEGKLLSYPEAMRDPLRETPLLRELAEAQQQQGKG